MKMQLYALSLLHTFIHMFLDIQYMLYAVCGPNAPLHLKGRFVILEVGLHEVLIDSLCITNSRGWSARQELGEAE